MLVRYVLEGAKAIATTTAKIPHECEYLTMKNSSFACFARAALVFRRGVTRFTVMSAVWAESVVVNLRSIVSVTSKFNPFPAKGFPIDE